jgi:signal transduction histidine kinase
MLPEPTPPASRCASNTSTSAGRPRPAGLVKNAVRVVANTVEAPQSNPAEVRALVRDLLVVVEETRLELLRGRGAYGPQPFAALWNALVRVLPDGMRGRCRLADGSADLLLSGTDYQLARRVVADLVTNAFDAGAQHVEVLLATIADGDFLWVEVQVRDDGPGMPAHATADPTGSLGILQWELRRYAGRLAFFNNGGGGATVNVRWRSPQWGAEPRSGRTPERV